MCNEIEMPSYHAGHALCGRVAVLQRFSFVCAVLEDPANIVVTELAVEVHVSEVVSTESVRRDLFISMLSTNFSSSPSSPSSLRSAPRARPDPSS